MRSGAQAGRWLAILDRLASSSKGLTIADLASELNCTPRTIYRDLAALGERLGAPLVREDDEDVGGPGRWKLVDGTRWRVKVDFTPAELLGLLAAERAGSPLAGTSYGAGIATLAAKVRARLGDAASAGAEADAAAIVAPAPQRSYAARAGIVDRLRRAIRDRTTVEMRYFSLSAGRTQSRAVDPYRLWVVDGAMYLIARCRRREETRTFLVDRIRGLEATGATFEVPEDFDAQAYVRNAFRVEHGTPAQVVIHFAKAVAPLVRERSWHPTQKLVPLPNGEVGLWMRVGGLDEVKRWVLGFGPAARVVGPPELVVSVHAEAEATAAMYRAEAEAAPAGSWRAPADTAAAPAMHRRRRRGAEDREQEAP